MRYRRIAAFSLACTVLVVGAVAAEQVEDPWRGKHRDEVIMALGPPDKIKGTGDRQILIYKLLVPGETPPLDARIRLLQLPGVGLVARIEQPAATTNEEMRLEPTQLDEEGRGVEGGYGRHSSASLSYDPKTGEVEQDWEAGPDPGKVKKITLKFEIDGDGLVQDWSVSPKKYLKGE